MTQNEQFITHSFHIFAKTFVKIFAKIFTKVFVIFVYFHLNIFAKTKIKFCENFRENAKTKMFVSTLLQIYRCAIFQFLESAHYQHSARRLARKTPNNVIANVIR
jgi:hypothetical protein